MGRFTMPGDIAARISGEQQKKKTVHQPTTSAAGKTAETVQLKTPAELKSTMKMALKGKDRVSKDQAKIEQGFLENLDRNQLLELFQTQLQGMAGVGGGEEEREEGADSLDGVDGPAEGGEEDEEYDEEQLEVFNSLFEAVEETRKKTEAMENTFQGMNAMAAALLASAQGGANKKKEPSETLQQAQHQRAIIGNNLLEAYAKQAQETEQENQARTIMSILTDSLAPLMGKSAPGAGAGAAATLLVDDPQQKKLPKSGASQTPRTTAGVVKPKTASAKRQQLQNHIKRFRKK